MDPLTAMLPEIDSNKEYPFNKDDYINYLLGNNLHSGSKRPKQGFGYHRSEIIVDIDTEYYYNNFGYRSSDWHAGSSILAVGCSNTFALGVPIEYSWPQILSTKINKDVRNLSIPGSSIMHLVCKMFAYFKEFGNPEIIFCLFPDPFRMTIPGNNNLTSGEYNKSGWIMNDVHLQKYSDSVISNRSKYSRIPHKYEDVLPLELSVFLSSQAIHLLEQYCSSNNIKLFWSSWDYPFSNTINTIETKVFDNFFYDQEVIISNNDMNFECHKEYAENSFKYFRIGLDNEDDPGTAHPGLHKHIHIAESFYKKLELN